MSEWGGLVPTGRRITGPSSDLVELDDGRDGLKHTAIAFHPRYREHSTLQRGIEIIRSFLDFPMVTGLVEVSAWMPDHGVFIYPTGTAWTAMEILRTFRDKNQTMSPRAVAELLYLSGMILQDAADVGPLQGVFSHSSLSPQRLLITADGQTQMIGYGLPQVELFVWREDANIVPHEDAFRYCPPERLRGGLEDSSADLFGLGLIAAELITGDPVYHGSIDAIRDQAAGGEAGRRFEKSKAKLPSSLKDLIVQILAGDPGDRGVPSDFVQSAERVLDKVNDGASLTATMEEVRQQTRRGKGIGSTDTSHGRGVPIRGPDPSKMGPAIPLSAVSMHTFSATAPTKAAEPSGDEPKRWGKSQRGKAEETPAPAAARTAGPSAGDRLRDRLKKPEESAAPSAAAPAPVADPKQALRDRLRRQNEAETPAIAAAAPAPPVETPKDPKDALRERLRRSAADAEPAATSPTPPPAAPVSDAKESLRDRLRRSAADGPPSATVASQGAAPASPPPEAPAASTSPPEAPAAPTTPALNDSRDALRDRLRRSREEAAPTPAPQATAPPPAAEPKADAPDDRRNALKERLKRKE